MENRKCALCGMEFTPKCKHNIYCSRYCKNHSYRIGGEITPIVCPDCMKPFVPRSYRQQVCPECEKKDQRNRIKHCMICGKAFTAKNRAQIYCSDHCREKAKRDRNTSSSKQKPKMPIKMKSLDKMNADDLLHYGKVQARMQLRRMK